jgi:hypothetical protein
MGIFKTSFALMAASALNFLAPKQEAKAQLNPGPIRQKTETNLTMPGVPIENNEKLRKYPAVSFGFIATKPRYFTSVPNPNFNPEDSSGSSEYADDPCMIIEVTPKHTPTNKAVQADFMSNYLHGAIGATATYNTTRQTILGGDTDRVVLNTSITFGAEHSSVGYNFTFTDDPNKGKSSPSKQANEGTSRFIYVAGGVGADFPLNQQGNFRAGAGMQLAVGAFIHQTPKHTTTTTYQDDQVLAFNETSRDFTGGGVGLGVKAQIQASHILKNGASITGFAGFILGGVPDLLRQSQEIDYGYKFSGTYAGLKLTYPFSK